MLFILWTKTVQQLFLLNTNQTNDSLNYKNKPNFKMFYLYELVDILRQSSFGGKGKVQNHSQKIL